MTQVSGVCHGCDTIEATCAHVRCSFTFCLREIYLEAHWLVGFVLIVLDVESWKSDFHTLKLSCLLVTSKRKKHKINSKKDYRTAHLESSEIP